MRELDLIPADYREFLFRLRLLRISSVVGIGLLFTLFVFHLAIGEYYQHLQTSIDQLEQEQAFTKKEKEKIASLETKQQILLQHLRLLEALSGHFTTQDLFLVVEQGLMDTDVWFERWQFERTQENVTSNKQATGYILEMPAGPHG